MGCDIHLHAEVRRGDEWVEILPRDRAESDCPDWAFNDFPLGWYGERHYAVFGALAGVRRSDVPLIDAPRGLPHDAAASTLADYGDSGDYHSASWFDLAEVLAYDWSEFQTIFVTQMRKLEAAAGGAPCRIVFWFDN